MPYEITNKLRGTVVIRNIGVGTNTITLANLSSDANETVVSSSIKRVNWTTNGSITITRDSVDVLYLYGSGEMRLDDYGHSIANTKTGNVVVTIASGGSCILELSKDTTYANNLVGI